MRAAVSTVPFVALALALRFVPLLPATTTPTPWLLAAANALLLLAAFAAHTWCYARWQPHAPRRILANELLARLWFVAFGMLVVGRASDNGLLFPLVALPWAVLSWEVHRQEVRQRGYDAPWNLAAWALFLVGLSLMELVAVRL